MKRSYIVAITIFLVLLADQILKIWIKTSLNLGESIPLLGERGMLYFIENKGMAFGFLNDQNNFSKYILSIVRIFASAFLLWYIIKLIKLEAKKGLIICLSLILAGAVGNLIDSAFYGLIFSESTYLTTATAFPKAGGYAGFLQGAVVDMFYFPLIQGNFPEWFPKIGGNHFVFFKPIFNLADAAVSTGAIALLVFYKKFFGDTKETEVLAEESENIEEAEKSKTK